MEQKYPIDLNKICWPLIQYGSTFLGILAAIWAFAMPVVKVQAQGFVEQTVNERLTILEQRAAEAAKLSLDAVNGLNMLNKQFAEESIQQEERQRQILCLIQQQQFGQPGPLC